MTMTTATSKSQKRAMNLLNITASGDDYADAKAALEAAGLPGDGLPNGHNWRSAGKLSDDELVKLLNASRPDYAALADSANDRDYF